MLSDAAQLAGLGVPQPGIDRLVAGIPHTSEVTPERAEALWAARRTLFFKPFAGFGSRATYRGDKLTQRVRQEILAGGYVAQRIATPSERRVAVDGQRSDLKLDVPAYAYAGTLRLVAARLYRGQTTNFRTPGGGFAPVFVAGAKGRPWELDLHSARRPAALPLLQGSHAAGFPGLSHPLPQRLRRGDAAAAAVRGGARRPAAQRLKDLFEFRLVLEIGMADLIMARVTPEDIIELKKIVDIEPDVSQDLAFNIEHETRFHGKLYEITGNETMKRFQKLLLPLFDYVHRSGLLKKSIQKSKYVSHKGIVNTIEHGTAEMLRNAMRNQLENQFARLI